jgi:TolB protein
MTKISIALAGFGLMTGLLAAASLGVFEKQADIGGGANMWLKTDAFQFVYRELSGDVTIAADLRFLGEGVEAHRKAALMIRQSLEPDSVYADVAVHGDGLTSLQYRAAAGADTQELRSEIKAPTRIRIERHGDQFIIAAGNGEDLKTTGPVTVSMHGPVYIGLAVCSHNANVLETAVFSGVTIQPGKSTWQEPSLKY